MTRHFFIHLCEARGCREWGGFGFGVIDLAKGKRGHWFCRRHRAQGERYLPAAASGVAPAPQGLLL